MVNVTQLLKFLIVWFLFLYYFVRIFYYQDFYILLEVFLQVSFGSFGWSTVQLIRNCNQPGFFSENLRYIDLKLV